jgi:hypothetical protein
MSSHIVVKRLESKQDAEQAFCCMSEVPTPWPEALRVCRTWVSQNLGRYVEGYHVQAADGTVIGQLYYALSEQALVPYQVESGAAVIYCEWVQRGRQKQAFGRQLFSAFEVEMRKQGCKGILVECTDSEEKMHYRHYLARGFAIVHETGQRKLLYYALHQPQIEVRALERSIQPVKGVPVEILVVSGYLCPFEMSTQVILEDVAREFGDRVVLRQEPLTPETLRRFGVADGIFINGRQKLTGAATEEAIRAAIIEELELA